MTSILRIFPKTSNIVDNFISEAGDLRFVVLDLIIIILKHL